MLVELGLVEQRYKAVPKVREFATESMHRTACRLLLEAGRSDPLNYVNCPTWSIDLSRPSSRIKRVGRVATSPTPSRSIAVTFRIVRIHCQAVELGSALVVT